MHICPGSPSVTKQPVSEVNGQEAKHTTNACKLNVILREVQLCIVCDKTGPLTYKKSVLNWNNVK